MDWTSANRRITEHVGGRDYRHATSSRRPRRLIDGVNRGIHFQIEDRASNMKVLVWWGDGGDILRTRGLPLGKSDYEGGLRTRTA